jgi:hypothetical protein
MRRACSSSHRAYSTSNIAAPGHGWHLPVRQVDHKLYICMYVCIQTLTRTLRNEDKVIRHLSWCLHLELHQERGPRKIAQVQILLIQMASM